MSRLDSAIRRLTSQKIVLEWAACKVRRLDGIILELGLGNGRTYDHLRGILPNRDIYVFERKIAAHPDCIPEENFLFLGDFRCFEFLADFCQLFLHRSKKSTG